MLQGEARRTASILHQTPGWRWRRELCLTERSQQCQRGPTTKAWRRLPARQRQTRVRHRLSTCEEQCQNWRETLASEGNVGRMRGIVRGTCGEHCRSCMEMGGACGWHRQTALSERVRVAPPGTPGTSADSLIGAGPSYLSCNASPQRQRDVTVLSLIEKICEL